MSEAKRELGIVGLGKMGANLALQAMERGIRVAGTDRVAPSEELTGAGLVALDGLGGFREAMSGPRAVFLYIPAGPAVDELIGQLADELEEGDLIVDAGNSYWGDSIRRYHRLKEQGIQFVDLGTSGGVDGARHGACFMAGGEPEAIARIEPILLDLATEDGYVHAGLREPGTSRSSSTTGSSSGCSRPSGRAWTYSNITVTGSTSLRF